MDVKKQLYEALIKSNQIIRICSCYSIDYIMMGRFIAANFKISIAVSKKQFYSSKYINYNLNFMDGLFGLC